MRVCYSHTTPCIDLESGGNILYEFGNNGREKETLRWKIKKPLHLNASGYEQRRTSI